MFTSEDKFMQNLLSDFKEESISHLQIISAGLLEIEKKTTNEADKLKILENIYRESHTLKGTARLLNLTEIEKICQGMENVFAIWKNNPTHILPVHIDLLYSAIDLIQQMMVDSISKNILRNPKKIQRIINQLNEANIPKKTKHIMKKKPAVASLLPLQSSTISISTKKFDKLFLRAEELFVIKLILDQRTNDALSLENFLMTWKKELDKISYNFKNFNLPDNIQISWNDFNDTNLALIKKLENKLSQFTQQIELDRYSIHGLIDNLMTETKKTLLLPFSTLLNIFPKMVRDLSRDQGKNVTLEIYGDEIEIDKRILEEIKESLIHIIRNSIDHGIEAPKERKKNNKSPEGLLKIAIMQHMGNEIEITITDDGRGIDKNAIITAAIQHGIITADNVKQLSDEAIYELIYHSGISTSPILTEISGHGLGMAIVKEKIEKIGGKIRVESIPLIGTTFTITLPLNIATYKGILLQVADQVFALPTAHIDSVLRIPAQQIKQVESNETILVNDKILVLIRLEDILEISENHHAPNNNDFIQAVIINFQGTKLALKVDTVLQEQEILVKNFMKPLKQVRNFSGATVLGSGKTIPILNVKDLIQSAIKRPYQIPTPVKNNNSEIQNTILLVEDSITTRVLLKNILELAGFQVLTAIDGVDAMLLLKSYHVSLIISDIEMPHMNGFELTEKIRKNKKLSHLPIILLTSCDSPADCQKGVELGANAYMLKSNFDSTNILEVIRRLI